MKQWRFSKLVFICGLTLLFIGLSASFFGARAAIFNGWPALKEGALDQELWDLIKGDWRYFQVVEGRLQAQLQPPSTSIAAFIPKPEHWPIEGDYELDFNYQVLDSADKNLAIYFDHDFKSNGSPALTFLSFQFIHGQLHVQYFIKEGLSRSVTIPYELEIGHDYVVNIIYQQPDFSLFLDNELVFSTVNDHDFWPMFEDGGRPMFYISRGIFEQSTAIFSNFKLKSLSGLPVPYFSQLDEFWGSEHYAHSGLKLTQTRDIADWGCALTSAVMILRYYGHEYFPDQDQFAIELRGQEITPGSLNFWLQQEADGYLVESLVNWLAISRLTYLLALEQAEKPVLEYQFASWSDDLIFQQLDLGQPVIANVPDHFLVIKGLTNGDYLVNDPLNDEELFSVNYSEIESLRLFQPSFTDLSYLLLVSPMELDFRVQNFLTEQDLPMLLNEPSFNGDYFLYYWPKPGTAEYLLFFDDLSLLEKVQLLSYQEDGQVNIFELKDYLAKKLKLDFFKDQPANLEIYQEEAELEPDLLIYQQLMLDYLLKLQAEQIALGQLDNARRYEGLIERFLTFKPL